MAFEWWFRQECKLQSAGWSQWKLISGLVAHRAASSFAMHSRSNLLRHDFYAK